MEFYLTVSFILKKLSGTVVDKNLYGSKISSSSIKKFFYICFDQTQL